MERIILLIKNRTKDKRNRRILIISIVLIIISILSYIFVSSNEGYYNTPIAKITSIHEIGDQNTGEEQVKQQQIKAVIMNGIYKDEVIELQNTTTYSQAYDMNYKVQDEVFVSIKENANKKIISTKIVEYKRDKYIAYITILFTLLILLIGGMKGFRTLISVVINIIIFSAIVGLSIKGYSIILVSSIASIFFMLVSISIVSGINKKSASAIIATIITTLITMLITVIVIKLTGSKGIHYEALETFSYSPDKILPVQILIGTLGGIMDIAITMASATKEMYDNNPNIARKTLVKSGKELGNDIMGTMANTLVFAYMSGSIPIILLLLKNGVPINYIINIDISLEIVRALVGSIGIVISIPVALFISVILLKNHTMGEA